MAPAGARAKVDSRGAGGSSIQVRGCSGLARIEAHRRRAAMMPPTTQTYADGRRPTVPDHDRVASNAEPSILTAALWYVAHGFPVFPVHSTRDGHCSCGRHDCEHPGKHPRTKHGFKDATSDRDQVSRWWTRWPDANIGIPTGKTSGLLVVDIDPRNGGDESWESLVSKGGSLPATAEQITGGGGRQVPASGPVPCGCPWSRKTGHNQAHC